MMVRNKEVGMVISISPALVFDIERLPYIDFWVVDGAGKSSESSEIDSRKLNGNKNYYLGICHHFIILIFLAFGNDSNDKFLLL